MSKSRSSKIKPHKEKAAVESAAANISNNQAFLQAVQEGDFERVKRLMRKGVDIDYTLEDGSTALHIATLLNHENIIDLLLDCGANTELLNKEGFSAWDNLRLWVDTSRHALDLLSMHRPLEEGSTILHTSVRLEYKDAVQLLLEKGATPNAPLDGSHFTPLHLAVKQGNAEIIDLLLAHGANPNVMARESVLSLAAQSSYPNAFTIVLKLIVKGADVKAFVENYFDNIRFMHKDVYNLFKLYEYRLECQKRGLFRSSLPAKKRESLYALDSIIAVLVYGADPINWKRTCGFICADPILLNHYNELSAYLPDLVSSAIDENVAQVMQERKVNNEEIAMEVMSEARVARR